MIFKLALPKFWNGKTPSLIVALRGQQELYFEALEIYQKTDNFQLGSYNVDLFKALPEKVFANIKTMGAK